MTESIVAAAASRIGKTVLHLDANDYYGNSWASFNLENIQNLPTTEAPNDSQTDTFDESTYTLSMKNARNIENFQQCWYDFSAQSEVNDWNRETISKEFRRFSIDLSPKLLFCRGSMVELLISSNISRYAEFRACDRVATVLDSTIKTVPCSRSDVFTNKDVNVVEKRLLMKLLNACMATDSTEFDGLLDKRFLDVLKAKKLTPNLIHYILFAIAMGNSSTSCSDGVNSVRKFLSSLGRFGNTPFLFPMYGSGEIPQCFCRLCAVFGGIYCLNTKIDKLYFKRHENEIIFEGILHDDRKITASNIVLGQGCVSDGIFFSDDNATPPESKCGGMSRGIFITSSPIGGSAQNTGGGGVMFLKLPPAESKSHNGAFVLQLSHPSGTVPKGLYLIHIICETITTAQDDLKPYVEQILKHEVNTPAPTPSSEDDAKSFTDETLLNKDTIPTILWSSYFQIPTCVRCTHGKMAPSGVQLACGPFFEVDFDQSIHRAKEMFEALYPDKEFLPRAPDPEEIVCEGEDATAPKVEIDPIMEFNADSDTNTVEATTAENEENEVVES